MLKTHRFMTWAATGLVVATTGLASLGAASRSAVTPVSISNPSAALSGAWKAPEYKVAVSGDLDTEVWGRGASKVRNVELMLEPNGEGVLRVRESVVDRKGVVRPYSATVIEARIKVEMTAAAEGADALRPAVRVLDAEERYLDDPKDRRKLDGVTVSLHMPASDTRMLNVRFDTPQGTGSFGETLNRRPS